MTAANANEPDDKIRETIELVRAFLAISDPELRANVVALVTAVGSGAWAPEGMEALISPALLARADEVID